MSKQSTNEGGNVQAVSACSAAGERAYQKQSLSKSSRKGLQQAVSVAAGARTARGGDLQAPSWMAAAAHLGASSEACTLLSTARTVISAMVPRVMPARWCIRLS